MDAQQVGGIKHDEGKPPLSLLDRKWLEGVANVLAFGAKKYSAHNWRSGFKHTRLADAALRHIYAWIDGEDLDPESGLSHLHHASCCLMFLANMVQTRTDLDDRFKGPPAGVVWAVPLASVVSPSAMTGFPPESPSSPT